MAKSKARHTVHGGRRHQNRNILSDGRHKRHCPRLFTTCSRSTITAIAKSRTVSSVSTSGSTGSSPLSFFTHCSSCSVHSRCFISPTLVTAVAATADHSAHTPRHRPAATGWCTRRDGDDQETPTRPALFSVRLHPGCRVAAVEPFDRWRPRLHERLCAARVLSLSVWRSCAERAPRTGNNRAGGSGWGQSRTREHQLSVQPDPGP
jgi:hypothetical protein